MSEKLKFAFYWGASCGGCEVAVLDINEKILDVSLLADIVLWPLALDGKYKDIEALPEKAIDVCFFNGGIRNSETEHIARLLREKSKAMVSFGACAGHGGVPALANQFDAEQVKAVVYDTAVSNDNPEKIRPQTSTRVREGELVLPELYDRVKPLDQVVPVDYYLPGCPPTVEWILKAVEAIAKNELPPPGSVIGLDKTLCEECPRERSNERSIRKFFRPHEIIPDPKKCLLEQGIICCGPATRGGCKARCVEVNMPCRGCFGPPPGVIDQGAKMLSAVASLVASDDEEEISRILADVRDPMGVFYQFSLGSSILRGSVKEVYTGREKRQHPRVKANFSVTYRVIEEGQSGGEGGPSRSKSLGLGGMLLTTNKRFEPDTKLAIEMHLPTDPGPLMLIGRVIESSEVAKDAVYDTRLEFMAVDEEHRDIIIQTVNHSGRTPK